MSWLDQMQSTRWDLERFGLHPTDVKYRVQPSGPRIHLVSVPKAGTHLLERLLCLYPGVFRRLIPSLNRWNVERYGGVDRVFRTTRPGRVLVTHLHHSPAVVQSASRHGLVNVFAIRDPRAVVLSKAHYLLSNRRHPYHQSIRDLSLEDALERVIDGDAKDPERLLLPAIEEFSRLSGWLRDATVAVRYEDLMSFESGGKRLEESAVAEVLDECGLAASDTIVESIARNAVSPVSRTYRRPRLRPWESLSLRQQHFLEEALAVPIADYGYVDYWDD